jgi:hypothetical protein
MRAILQLGKNMKMQGTSNHTFCCVYKSLTKFYRETLEQAVGVYKQDEAYNIELSRTKFKLHQVFARLDMVSESQEALKDAERLRKKSMGEGWIAAQEEADYDSVVMFWSR